MDLRDPILFNLTDRVENPGDSYAVNGVVRASSYAVGQKEFQVEDGFSFDAVFTNTGDGILATGIVRASATGACDRCLEPASFEVAGEIQEYYLFAEPDDPDAFEDGYEVVGEDRVVDLSDAIYDAVAIDTPFVVLCDPDCKGLCPTCGANLNRETCDCAAKRAEEDAASSPFAVLKDMSFDEEPEVSGSSV